MIVIELLNLVEAIEFALSSLAGNAAPFELGGGTDDRQKPCCALA